MRCRERGLTWIELLVAVTVLAVVATAAMPLYRWDEKRRREEHLRMTLETVRGAIDLYKKYCDEGMIVQTDVDQKGYPRDLDELVSGVQIGDPNSPESSFIQFLRRIPVDPITGRAEWGLRSYQDDWDSQSWGGENVWDIYSLAPGRALDGSSYSDW